MGWFMGEKPKIRRVDVWSPQQQQMGSQLYGTLTGQLGGLYAPGGLGGLTQGVLEKYLTTGGLEPEATRGYLENVMYAPMKKQLIEETLPSIAAGYGKGGAYFSTARAGMEQKAREQLETQFAQRAQDIAYQELMASKQRQMAALGMGMTYQEQLLNQIQNYLRQQPYQYIVQPGQEGILKSIISAVGTAAGGYLGKWCYIVNELYGLNTIQGMTLFDRVNFVWPKTFIGNVLNKLYRKFSKPISVFISKKNFVSKITRKMLKVFFDNEFKKELKNATSNLYAT